MSKVARLPLALIIAATMLMTLVSTVAAAPSAGSGGSKTALATHDEGTCDIVLEGATAAALEADLMAQLPEGAVLDDAALAVLRSQLAAVADFDGTACVDLDTLTVYSDVCVTDLAVLADLVTEAEFDAIIAALQAEAEAAGLLSDELQAIIDAGVALTPEQEQMLIAELQALLDADLIGPIDCLALAVDIGDIVAVVDTEIVCVEITAVGELAFEVVFGDAALLDDTLVAELGALLATLDLEVGDVVCVVLIPFDGDFVLGPVVVIVAGDVNVNIGDVVIGDITIGDCSNAVITVIVNGQNVEVDVVQNVDDQCVAVVPAPAPDDDDDAAPSDDDDTPGMLPDTGVSDAPVYGALIVALVALVSVGTLGYANISARRNR